MFRSVANKRTGEFLARRRRRSARRPVGESLETRHLLAAIPWNDTSQLTLSFVPDGTDIGGEPSELFATFDQVVATDQWKETILSAFQTWAVHTTLNIGVVSDEGQPLGTPGPRTQDSRFGDIRIAARPLHGDVMALGVSQDAVIAGTWAGDVIFNTQADFNTLDDIFAISLHEAGHVFGLPHSADPQSPMHNHGLPVSTTLTEADIEQVQRLHGQRPPDVHEHPRGNDTLRSATRLSAPALGMPLFIPPILVFGDISTTDDVDYFALPPSGNLAGQMTIRLQTSGISLLAPSLRLLNSRGEEVGLSVAMRPGGSTLLVQIDEAESNERYFVEVSSARSDEFAIGEYSLIVSFDSLPQVDGSRVEDVATARNRELGEDQLRRLMEDENALLNLDLHQDDSQSNAADLNARRGFSDDRHFSTVASVSDDRDVDYYRFVAPKADETARMFVNLTVRSLNPEGLIPKATLFDARRDPLEAEILVNGNGEFVVQAPIEPRKHYFVRVEADDDERQVGNYRISLSIVDDWVEMNSFMSGRVGDGTTTSVSEVIVVERPQLFHVALDAGRAAIPEADDDRGQVVVARFMDEDDGLLASLVAPVHDTRTTHGLLMMPGNYRVDVLTLNPDDDADEIMPVDFRLRGASFSNPFGTDPVDPTEDPIFLCPGEDQLFCYPGGIVTPEPFLWEDFLDSLAEVPDLELEELITVLMGDWWKWYWAHVGENGPALTVTDAYQVDAEWPLIVDPASGVLGNDLDPEGDVLSALLTQVPSHGSVTLNADGSFTYIPHAGFVGVDAFQYVARDAQHDSSPASVIIEIVDEGRLPADFNRDDRVNHVDVDLLCGAVQSAQHHVLYDLTGDALVNQHDLRHLIQNLLQTTPGDATVDGVFDSSDLVRVFQEGHYERGIVGAATWSTGDWNCDGLFDSTDMVLAFQEGNYAGAPTHTAESSQPSLLSPRPSPDQMDESRESDADKRRAALGRRSASAL